MDRDDTVRARLRIVDDVKPFLKIGGERGCMDHYYLPDLERISGIVRRKIAHFRIICQISDNIFHILAKSG
jgi:mRNA-degrading endonuclease RelE of RelBE toxin-antitoxin system